MGQLTYVRGPTNISSWADEPYVHFGSTKKTISPCLIYEDLRSRNAKKVLPPFPIHCRDGGSKLFTFHLEVDADVQEEGVAVDCEVVILGDIGQTELVASL